MTLNFENLTPKQLEMINTPARQLFVGAGTKTGKSAAAHADCAIELMQGKSVCWIGPWSEQSYLSYGFIKKILKPFIDAKLVKANDSKAHLSSKNGGTFVTKTGDNPEAIYGGGYDLVIIDEASRQTEESLIAAQSTTTVTKGKIKLMFNLDHGAANWAIRHLIRVKTMSLEERAESKESYMVFPTGGGGLVSQEEIELKKKSGMPRSIFEALYNAQIPDTDLSLFHNLAYIFKGPPVPQGPEVGHYYVAGMDVARKKDWTALTVFDVTQRKVVAMARFHEIAWNLQYAKAKQTYDYWNCQRMYVDATGLGDPVEDALHQMGVNVVPFIFTPKSRTQLIEQLVLACDEKAFTVCNAPSMDTREDFQEAVWQDVLREELTVFQVMLDPKNGKVSYGVSTGQNDDAAFSLMLAWHNYLAGGHGPVEFRRTKTDEEVAANDWGAM